MMCFGVKDRKPARTNHCVIVLLDDTQLVHELHTSSTGQDLLDVVIKHLNLLETSYFGLKYLDTSSSSSQSAGFTLANSHGSQPNNSRQYNGKYGNSNNSTSNNNNNNNKQVCWLDVNKSAIKQLKNVQPMTVYFGVKYYATDPCKLVEEITRYQFFLQCKQDLLHSRLQVNFELAVELFALAVQSELGDYDPQRHLDGYVSEFQFLPSQSKELEKRVAIYHRSLCGQVPATAELNFLERVKWLDLYGAEIFPIQYDNDDDDDKNNRDSNNYYEDYSLALNPSGVLVLKNNSKVAHYPWPRIVKTKCQGRCFLMDVIQQQSNQHSNKIERNRFGFRLANKHLCRKLAWAIEEHKSFYHLLHSSLSGQMSFRSQNNNHNNINQQQQSMKLSQRFRNSIRSAINVGGGVGNVLPGFGNHAHAQLAHHQQQLLEQQQQRLRSSVKSLNISERKQPTVVRMPSRRYGANRSSMGATQSVSRNVLAAGAAPPMVPGMAHTMVESQRQQALLMMSHFNQMQAANGNVMMGKSQTLRPSSKSAAAAAAQSYQKDLKKNPYYQQLMMMLAQQQQQHPNSMNQPDITILPPGRHIIQPAIYKASSVINGINQLEPNARPAQLAGPAMLQFFNTPAKHYSSAGHESPRSTKSAMAPSNAFKLASKKLAKQQQLAIYNNRNLSDVQPLLAGHNTQQQFTIDGYPSMPPPQEYSNQYHGYTSANQSPRSVRSARIRHRSKSTSENLNLIHQQQQQQMSLLNQHPEMLINPATKSKMLLATTQQLISQNLMAHPGPPAYNNSSLLPESQSQKKRANFVGNDAFQGQSQSGSHKACKKQAGYSDEDEDDYCCSRSDCSSIVDIKQPTAQLRGQARGACRVDEPNSNPTLFRNRRTSSSSIKAPVPPPPASGVAPATRGEDWNAIRKRHSEFSSGKGNFSNLIAPQFTNKQIVNNNNPQQRRLGGNQSMELSPSADLRRQPLYSPDQDIEEQLSSSDRNNNNNNSQKPEQLLKNIANKQATPILLSMNHQFVDGNNNKIINGKTNEINCKAVEMLNYQRQQLSATSNSNSPGSEVEGGMPGKDNQLDSTPPSSMPSSPQTNNPNIRSRQAVAPSSLSSSSGSSTTGKVNQNGKANVHPSDHSTSSATSGYYAGSNNSTGSASIDSQDIPESAAAAAAAASSSDKHKQHSLPASRRINHFDDWPEEGTRSKIALGSYAGRISSANRLIIGNKTSLTQNHHLDGQQMKSQKRAYFGEIPTPDNVIVPHQDHNQAHQDEVSKHQWNQSATNQSLKYVSFDV